MYKVELWPTRGRGQRTEHGRETRTGIDKTSVGLLCSFVVGSRVRHVSAGDDKNNFKKASATFFNSFLKVHSDQHLPGRGRKYDGHGRRGVGLVGTGTHLLRSCYGVKGERARCSAKHYIIRSQSNRLHRHAPFVSILRILFAIRVFIEG